MNILLLSQFFSTTRGGGEYVISLIAKNLANNGHKVWVITNKINDENYESHKNIELIFVKPNLEYKGGLPPSLLDNMRYTINTIIAGLHLIKKEKINVIHSNNFSPALAGSALSYITSKPHITSIWDIFSLCGNDYWDKWTRQAGVSKIHVFLGPRFEKLILKLRHDVIHTISETSKEDLIKFGAKKPIYMIPPSIELSHRQPAHPNSLQFVYIGRLVFYKNVEIILKAIKIIKKTEPKVKLVIIGSGPHKKTLQDLASKLEIEKNIEFKGYITSDEKLEILSKSSALVFPSLCEGFGLVILESFDQSRPVLVSNTRPMSDIVTHQKNGFVIDPHDENQWASHMLDMIKNPQRSNEMGKNGNDMLTKSYDQDKMCQDILRMYSDIILDVKNCNQDLSM